MVNKSNSISETIREELKTLGNPKLAAFNAKLLIDISEKKILGIYTKDLRSLAKNLATKEDITPFLKDLPHYYVEENLLHGYLLAYSVHDITLILKQLEKFLPFIDNWMVCDQCCAALKILNKNPDIVHDKVLTWLQSPLVYTQRFALVTLLDYFLGENFSPEILQEAAKVQSSEYYVNMALAWFFSMALVKHYDCAVKYFEPNPPAQLSDWVHNKSIQKAMESFQIDKAHKAYLKGLKK